MHGWREHRDLIGYVALVAIVIFAVQLYELHTTRQLNRTQRQIGTTWYSNCLNNQILASNQAALVASIVSLADSPEFHKLGLRQSEMEFAFRSALTHEPHFACVRPSWWPPEVADYPDVR